MSITKHVTLVVGAREGQRGSDYCNLLHPQANLFILGGQLVKWTFFFFPLATFNFYYPMIIVSSCATREYLEREREYSGERERDCCTCLREEMEREERPVVDENTFVMGMLILLFCIKEN